MELPDYLLACVGGGSNAIGLFYPFIDDQDVAMYGVEAAGHGIAIAHIKAFENLLFNKKAISEYIIDKIR